MDVQDIVLKDISPRTTAYLKCRGTWRQLTEMLAKLNGCMSRSGVQATGPASGVYYNTPNEINIQDLEWEVFYPVALDTPELVEGNDGFGIRRIPEARVATIVHQGPYRKASSSYEHLGEWIKREGLEVCGPAEEVYLTDIMIPAEKPTIEIHLPVSSA